MAAPTGCFKCGRPGHWSRDCPSSNPNPDSNPNSRPNLPKFNKHARETPSTAADGSGGAAAAAAAAAKKVPRTRPKLTPELLLSDNGLGYVLKHFPRAFKYRGRGHEVADLGNLIAMYAQWHSQLLPYYSFDQFIQKVEKVGTTKRVRTCLRDLRQRVANGGDPTKLHEPPTEQADPDCEHEMMETETMNGNTDPPVENEGAGEMEEMFVEIYQKATEETQGTLQKDLCGTHQGNPFSGSTVVSDLPSKPRDQEPCSITSGQIQITEEQKARMEVNRLKALEKAAARRALQTQAS